MASQKSAITLKVSRDTRRWLFHHHPFFAGKDKSYADKCSLLWQKIHRTVDLDFIAEVAEIERKVRGGMIVVDKEKDRKIKKLLKSYPDIVVAKEDTAPKSKEPRPVPQKIIKPRVQEDYDDVLPEFIDNLPVNQDVPEVANDVKQDTEVYRPYIPGGNPYLERILG